MFRAYIPASDDLVPEVLLSQKQLENWRDVLGKFKTFWSMLRTGEKSREQVVNALVESISSVLRLEIDDSGMSLGDFVQLKGGLPHGGMSKLMAYTPEELRKSIPECEIRHLVNYAAKKADIIKIALEGDQLASFTQEELGITACPDLTAKGKSVPHVRRADTGSAERGRQDEFLHALYQRQRALLLDTCRISAVTIGFNCVGMSAGWGKQPLIKGLDLDIDFSKIGQCLPIVGRTGVGKSTLLYVLSGMAVPSAGRVTWRLPQHDADGSPQWKGVFRGQAKRGRRLGRPHSRDHGILAFCSRMRRWCLALRWRKISTTACACAVWRRRARRSSRELAPQLPRW